MASRNRSTSLTALEVFAGAGGLALGIERAGFKHLAVIDAAPSACATLRLNQQKRDSCVHDWEVLESDVKDVVFASYHGKVDLLAGGPPCQPFSFGGKHGGRDDRRDLFPQLIRAVRETSPKAFIIENVKGLLREKFSKYFEYVILQLRFPHVCLKPGEQWRTHRARLEKLYTGGKTEPQYRVISQSLFAPDFGIPQRRDRVFIIGVRADLEIEYSFPLPSHSRQALLRQQWVTGKYWKRHGISSKPYSELRPTDSVLERIESATVASLGKPWVTVRDALDGLPPVAIGKTSHKVANHFLNPGARGYAKHRGSLLDYPSKTIKAGYHGVPGGENMLCLGDGSIRYYSVRECARLQTFPDSWEFAGTWTSGMRQLGNAVPVELAARVVAPLAAALKQ